LNFEVLCKRDVRSRDRDETETFETETTTLVRSGPYRHYPLSDYGTVVLLSSRYWTITSPLFAVIRLPEIMINLG